MKHRFKSGGGVLDLQLDLLFVVLILIAGVIAGFLNTVAGGGSIISLPFLIFLGLPAQVANGTNRVGMVAESWVAVWNFRRKGYFDWNLSILFGIPAIIGSLIGAQIAINTPDGIFNKILGFVMLFILWLSIRPSKAKADGSGLELSKKKKIIGAIGYFLIGIYGGFIHVGVGFIMIAFTSNLMGISLVMINSIKALVTGLFLTISLITFIASGNVDWIFGLIMAVGSGIGAWLGSNFSISKGDVWIKRILIVTVIAMAGKLLLGI